MVDLTIVVIVTNGDCMGHVKLTTIVLDSNGECIDHICSIGGQIVLATKLLMQ